MDIPTKLTRSVTRLEQRIPSRGGGLRLSLFDSPMTLPQPSARAEGSNRDRKLLSVELELAGMAVELKARNLGGLLAWLSVNAVLAAVIQQLARPRQFRTWHGRVAGLIPYDFRKPTFRRVLDALWAPHNPRLFTDTAFGVGWSVNLAQLPRILSGRGPRAVTRRPYEPPKVEATA